MGSESPNVILYDVNGQEMSISNGVAIPSGTSALMIAGSDGTNSRFFTVDGSGRLVVVGSGTAGTSSGGVITIQGISGGVTVPVTGTISVTQNTSPWVTNISQFGGVNISTGTGASGTGIPRVTVSNDSNILATQSGTWTTTVTQSTPSNLRVQTSSESATGAVAPTNAIFVGGIAQAVQSGLTTGDIYPLSLTTTGLLRIDGSNVTQPVSGTVTANQGTPGTIGNYWYVGITDGTHGPVGVTPASTAATATQLAQVVAPSPNTSGPVQIISPNELAAALSPATVFPAGFLRTSDEPVQYLHDSFDGSTLDTNNWQNPVSSGGGVAPAVGSGYLTLGTGTTAGGYAYLQSQNSFRLTTPGWLGISHSISFENPVTLNTYRFWGQGTVPTTPTASSKTTVGNSLTNAIGWELGADQKLLAVVWFSGTRIIIADLSASTGSGKQPSDGQPHRYILYIRTDRIYWYIDTLDVPVVTASYQYPSIQTLPDLFLAIAGTTAPSSSGTITCVSVSNWDTGKNFRAISDGIYPWRKSTIKAASTAPSATDTALVTEARAPSTPTVTAVAASTTSVQLKAANSNRRGLSIFNQSTSPLYLLHGTGTATTTYGGFSVIVWPQTLYELPNQCGAIGTFAIQGIWLSANAGCSVTEVTF